VALSFASQFVPACCSSPLFLSFFLIEFNRSHSMFPRVPWNNISTRDRLVVKTQINPLLALLAALASF